MFNRLLIITNLTSSFRFSHISTDKSITPVISMQLLPPMQGKKSKIKMI